MNKVRGLSSFISIDWLVVGATLVIAALAGFAISAGKIRTLALLLLPFGLLMICMISERIKVRILAFSIPLSLVQIPSLPIPYGFTLCEIILLLLTIDELLFPRNDRGLNVKSLRLEIFIPMGLFTFAVLVTALRNGGIDTWHTYCLMPLLWFFLVYRKIHNWKDAWLFIKLSLLTIISFVAIVVWANATGHFKSLEFGTNIHEWRLGYGLLVALGPIRLNVWSTIFGSLASLGFPASIILWIGNEGKRWWRVSALLMLGAFTYVLISSAARGAVVAAILATMIVLLVSGRFRSLKLLGGFVLLLVVVALWGETILKLFPEQNIQRLLTLLQGVQGDPNLQVRTNALESVWKFTLQNPLGMGFGYLWNTYRIDDAIIYANILEGTGILGAIAFVMIVGQLAFKFVLTIIKSLVGSTRDIASIGLSTLVVGLVAGVSSQSILFEPVHAFVFWALMAVCYNAVQIPELELLADIQLVQHVRERLSKP
jgi:hypothetical protein